MNVSSVNVAIANFVFLLFIVGLVLDFNFIRNKDKWVFTAWVERVPWRWVDVLLVVLFFVIYEEAIGAILYWVLETWKVWKVYEGLLIWVSCFLVEALTLIFLVRLLKLRYGTGLKELGVFKSLNLKDITKGLTFYWGALPLLFLAGLLTKLISDSFEIPLEPQAPFQMLSRETSLWSLAFISVFIVCIAPFIEEIIFRGFLYPWLKKFLGIRGAMILSAVFFAMLHFSFLAFFPIIVIGLCLAYLYEKTGSLLASIMFHVMNNFVALVVFLLVYK